MKVRIDHRRSVTAADRVAASLIAEGFRRLRVRNAAAPAESLTSEVPYKRQHIATLDRREVWAMNCAVCGVPYGVQCDHIIPVTKGGSSARSNLQPLCSPCNLAKKNRHDNNALREIIKARGVAHFRAAVFRHDTQYDNPYDGPSESQWFARNPGRLAEAHRLWEKFIDSSGLAE